MSWNARWPFGPFRLIPRGSEQEGKFWERGRLKGGEGERGKGIFMAGDATPP